MLADVVCLHCRYSLVGAGSPWRKLSLGGQHNVLVKTTHASGHLDRRTSLYGADEVVSWFAVPDSRIQPYL